MSPTIKTLTAVLAKDAGYPQEESVIQKDIVFASPTYHQILEFIREEKGIHIIIDRTASGYRYCLCKNNSGTSLGTSHHTGPNHAGQWDVHDTCLDNAINVALSYDLPKDNRSIGHWSNYAAIARKECAKKITAIRAKYTKVNFDGPDGISEETKQLLSKGKYFNPQDHERLK